MYFYNFPTMLIIYLPPVAQGQWDYVISSDGVNVNHFSQASATRLPAGHGEVVPSPSVPALQAAGELQVLAEPSAVTSTQRSLPY